MTDYLTNQTSITVNENSRIAPGVTIGSFEPGGGVGMGNVTLENYGTVFGTFAITASLNRAPGRIVNKGVIVSTSAFGAAITIGGAFGSNPQGALDIYNIGRIAAFDVTTVAIKGWAGRESKADFVTNLGTIIGIVTLEGGADLYDGRGGSLIGELILGDGDDTGLGGDGAETMRGGSGADALIGGGGGDVLDGGADDDVLDGGTGDDRMIGGTGDDLFFVDSARDLVFEAAGEGTDTVVTSVSYTLRAGQEIEALTANPANDLTGLMLTGNAYAQTITGDAGANRITGGGGDDVLIGLGGDDTYIVTEFDLVVEDANGGYDTVLASSTYTLADNVEEARFADARGTGAMGLIGNDLDNRLVGNAGNNLLNGGAGADTLIGGAGNDRYVVNDGDDVVSDASGTDTVLALIDYVLSNAIENLTLLGDATAGTGNRLANIITGNDGDNFLNGRGGLDTLTGGEGADTFVFDVAVRAASFATITDFESGADRIALDDAVFRRIGSAGALSDAFFTDGPATTRDQHVLYDASTGVLSYDFDGSGTAFAAVAFASVTAGTALTAADIFVI